MGPATILVVEYDGYRAHIAQTENTAKDGQWSEFGAVSFAATGRIVHYRRAESRAAKDADEDLCRYLKLDVTRCAWNARNWMGQGF